jgi:hypothetical protein
MKFLSRIPFWLWLLILTVLCYSVWNASGVSFYHMLFVGTSKISTKILVSIIITIVFALFISATYRSLGKKGLFAYLALVGATLYFLFDHKILKSDNVGILQHVAPFLVALLLAIGSQASKMYRAITGRVSVEDNDTVHPDEQHDIDE